MKNNIYDVNDGDHYAIGRYVDICIKVCTDTRQLIIVISQSWYKCTIIYAQSSTK